jgi:hypothetical protein
MFTRLMTVAVLALLLGAAACNAEVENEGELPKVDVDASGGEMPKVDVDPANVNVSTDTQTVVTPDVNVTPAGDNEKN